MTPEEQENLLMKITDAFGFVKEDFEPNEEGKLVPIYTKWGTEDKYIDIEDLGDLSFKISKNLGDIYIDKIKTNGWVIVGKGTTLHCNDLTVGEELVTDFEGYLL